MAIGFGELRTISRSRGESSTAATAYRAGISVDDEHTGEKHDYNARKKNGEVEALEIIVLDGGKIPSRSELWNAVKKSEKRKNAILARKWIGAFCRTRFPAIVAANRGRFRQGYCKAFRFGRGCLPTATPRATHMISPRSTPKSAPPQSAA